MLSHGEDCSCPGCEGERARFWACIRGGMECGESPEVLGGGGDGAPLGRDFEGGGQVRGGRLQNPPNGAPPPRVTNT